MISRLLLAAVFGVLSSLRPASADDVLFIGNSFTFGAEAPAVRQNGGVPKLFEEIARAKGRQVSTSAVTHPGANWAYHLAQPLTGQALDSKAWTWVVLQDASIAPTRIGSVADFLRDGEIFSQRIAQTSPNAGIILYETWTKPPGAFYWLPPGNHFSAPAQMMQDLHESYAQLRDDLAAADKDRPVRVAEVGTAFARVSQDDPEIKVNAGDRHHASVEGYYLAALVIYETIYHDSARGAPASFFKGQLVIPASAAARLQAIADQVAGN